MTLLHDVIPLHAAPQVGQIYEIPGNAAGHASYGQMHDGVHADLADPTQIQLTDTITWGNTPYQVTGLWSAKVHYEQQAGKVTYDNIDSWLIEITDPAHPAQVRYVVIPLDSRLAVSYPNVPIPSVQTQGVINKVAIQGMTTTTTIPVSSIQTNEDLDTYCFTAGTMVQTGRGPVPVELIAPGDLVQTRDHGLQPVRWTGRRTLSADELAAAPKLRPVRIAAGALGEGLPQADLLVSPQHRVLVRSKIARKMFCTDEVLVAAKQLTLLDGIDVAEDIAPVTYVHILFDAHQIVFSNGAETESLYTGAEALKSVGPAARDEIFAIFPELKGRTDTPAAARTLVNGRMGHKLAVRHANNRRPLVMWGGHRHLS